jgi:hypothetical protein
MVGVKDFSGVAAEGFEAEVHVLLDVARPGWSAVKSTWARP